MNQESRYLMGIYQVAVIVRDTLEYGIPKPNYDKNIYLQRKASILHGLEENAPLTHFLNQQNEEIGTKIRKNLDDFVNLVYGDEARVCHIDGDNLVVDPAFSNQVFDYVVGIRETLNDIVAGFMSYNKTNGKSEEAIEVLIEKDLVFYRSITLLVLSDALHRLFLEFNRTMSEAKGKENPQSSFVVNELSQVIGFINFVRDHSKIEDPKFINNVNATVDVIQLMTGQTKPEQGKTIGNYINDLHESWTKYCQVAELDWKKNYVEVWQDLADYERDLSRQQDNSNAQPSNPDNKD